MMRDINSLPRYAIYYSPEKGSDFAMFGNRWLGRDAETGLESVPLPVQEYTVREIARITAAPGHYGFHATLKPPFRLAADRCEEELCDFAHNFAAAQSPFLLSGLEVREVGAFLALVPQPQHEAARLAENCLREFDPFRDAPSLAEMEKYRQRGLPLRQIQYLTEWGYPYVLADYLFHITLTDILPDSRKRKRIRTLLGELTRDIRRTPHPVREICIFRQPDRKSPFHILCRCPFGNPKREAA